MNNRTDEDDLREWADSVKTSGPEKIPEPEFEVGDTVAGIVAGMGKEDDPAVKPRPTGPTIFLNGLNGRDDLVESGVIHADLLAADSTGNPSGLLKRGLFNVLVEAGFYEDARGA